MFLEMAAGTGVLTRALSRCCRREIAVTATDLNPAVLDQAKSHPNQERATSQEADALSRPFFDRQFDCVLCHVVCFSRTRWQLFATVMDLCARRAAVRRRPPAALFHAEGYAGLRSCSLPALSPKPGLGSRPTQVLPRAPPSARRSARRRSTASVSSMVSRRRPRDCHPIFGDGRLAFDTDDAEKRKSSTRCLRSTQRGDRLEAHRPGRWTGQGRSRAPARGRVAAALRRPSHRSTAERCWRQAATIRSYAFSARSTYSISLCRISLIQ